MSWFGAAVNWLAGLPWAVAAGAVWRMVKWSVMLLAFAVLAMLLIGDGYATVRRVVLGGVATASANVLSWATGVPTQSLWARGSAPGFLYIEPPQLYTRERLVNDRFRQANWLTAELRLTSDPEWRRRVQAPSRVESRSRERAFSLWMLGEQPLASTASPSYAPADELGLDLSEVFDKMLAHRGQIRNELLDTQLDDGHDINGNTLYRLNFDAQVMPWADQHADPGSAIFIIEARKPVDPTPECNSEVPESNPEQTASAPEAPRCDQKHLAQVLADDLDLLRTWQREMQAFLSRVVAQRVETFAAIGRFENPTDPKENIAFDWFLRVTLIEALLDVLADRVQVESCTTRTSDDPRHPCNLWPQDKTAGEVKQLSGEVKQLSNAERKEQRDKRRDLLAEWLEIEYRSDRPSPRIEGSELAEKMFLAVSRAKEVNLSTEIKPNPNCEKDEKRKRNAAKEKRNAAKEKGETTTEEEDEFNARLLKDFSDGGCSNVLNFDPQFKRAMLRLAASLRRIQQATGASKVSDKAQGFAIVVDLTADADNAANTRAEAIRLLETLASADQAPADLAECRSEARKTGDPVQIGLCLLSGASLNTVAPDLIAQFILARLDGELPTYADNDKKIGDFFDIRLAGCDFAGCVMEVASRRSTLIDDISAPFSRDDKTIVRFDEKKAKDLKDRGDPCARRLYDRHHNLGQESKPSEIKAFNGDAPDLWVACTLSEWLDNDRNDVAVYGVSPRTGGEVARSSVRSSLSTRVAAASPGGVSGGVSDDREDRSEGVGIAANIIGFSQITDENTSAAKAKDSATFGWVVRPQRTADGRWPPSHNRLAAVVSVPSWWKRLEFEVVACWTTPAAARALGEKLFKETKNVCEDLPPEIKRQRLKRTFRIPLPRRARDVTERFRFEFVQTPYWDADWSKSLRSGRRSGLMLEAGRPGQLVLSGDRLWRGTVVTLGSQPADSIVVLPDMKGVIAEFRCVPAPPGEYHVRAGAKPKDSTDTAEASGSKTKMGADSSEDAKTTSSSGVDVQGDKDNAEADASEKKAGAGSSDDDKNKPNGEAKQGGSNEPPAHMVSVTVWTSEGRTPLNSVEAEIKPFVPRSDGDRPCFVPPLP